LKGKLKHDFDNTAFNDETYLKEVIEKMAKSEPKLLQEYDDGINVAAKYCNTQNRTKPDSKPDDDSSQGTN
jgi:hypothetical protein